MFRRLSGIGRKRIRDVMQPVRPGLPERPFVDPEDTIGEAVECMVENNLNQIIVIRKAEAVGMVTLEALLLEMGLDSS